MAVVVDRRDQTGNGVGNRERFLDRYRGQIKKAIDRSIANGNITDIGKGGADVVVPREDIREPTIHSAPGGVNQRVHPGNKTFRSGDRLPKPKGGQGGTGSGEAADGGEGVQDFVFHISEEEFRKYFFADLALPNMVRKSESNASQFEMKRAGMSSTGTEASRDLPRSRRRRLGRLMASEMPYNESILNLLKKQAEILTPYDSDYKAPPANEEWVPIKYEITALEDHLEGMKARVRQRISPEEEKALRDLENEVDECKSVISLIPRWVEATDMRYRRRDPHPVPTSKAAMFCLMDVSGSMDEEKTTNAKIFFFLLYLFLTDHYDQVETVFIRHTTTAQEVDQEKFFKGNETGGTVVSTAIELMDEIRTKRYAGGDWNVYGAQASDGDNIGSDSIKCRALMAKMLPELQAYFYTEITKDDHQNLWDEFEILAKEFADKFFMGQIKGRQEIYPVFREFFKKRGNAASPVSTAAWAPAI